MRVARILNFSKHPKRRIALMLLYHGWEHDGLVTQRDVKNTVEECLLSALLKTRLIEIREQCEMTRCGRTDKGVSGFRQVIAVNVRSADVGGEGVYWQDERQQVPSTVLTNTGEMSYAKMLNSKLPNSIRVMAWSPVGREFNARHNCRQRSYLYIFPKGRVDINRMQKAAARLVGAHDFRNFCSIDKGRAGTSHVREIYSVEVNPRGPEDDGSVSGSHSLVQLSIKASAFLYHQIRCIVTVLYLIGMGKEEPEVIDYLLDVERCLARPQYQMGNSLPLCFFNCEYSADVDLKWVIDPGSFQQVQRLLQRQWAECQVKAALLKSMLDEMSEMGSMEANGAATLSSSSTRRAPDLGICEFTIGGEMPVREERYVRMEKRNKCKSIEEWQADLQAYTEDGGKGEKKMKLSDPDDEGDEEDEVD